MVPGALFSARSAVVQSMIRAAATVAVMVVSSVMSDPHSQPSSGPCAVAAEAIGVYLTRGGAPAGCRGNPTLNGHSIKFPNAFRLGIRRFRA